MIDVVVASRESRKGRKGKEVTTAWRIVSGLPRDPVLHSLLATSKWCAPASNYAEVREA